MKVTTDPQLACKSDLAAKVTHEMFYSLKKPGPECTPLSDAEFFDYCKLNFSDLLASSKDSTKGLCEAKYVAAVRRWSETVVFTCTQLRRLLRRVETPLAR